MLSLLTIYRFWRSMIRTGFRVDRALIRMLFFF